MPADWNMGMAGPVSDSDLREKPKVLQGWVCLLAILIHPLLSDRGTVLWQDALCLVSLNFYFISGYLEKSTTELMMEVGNRSDWGIILSVM